MEKLHHLITQSVRRSGVQPSVEAAKIVDEATAILGSLFGVDLASHMKPLYVKNRTLTVSCTSSTVAQELKLRETEILEKLNLKLAGRLVDRIRYFS
ncbi:hypothetical protein A3H75_01780 [Candidatus Uhrbacteria bacterium RIFCSPLOWO2_02_FULL_51_9]|uniref:DUF721 domain-containing protein n=1 Tax=Candidatus Uhrbacteria bacterium RIFCSPLOWO2_02_FULL_51_9 TaxID=1802410 RepID=A0A1F7VD73_9BACT|nr:MAG: hypothetical protein A3H75_01780 [Candidatus Uhrbacteria bacterium RIFCSPLOWO2_02_FULL_51_9]